MQRLLIGFIAFWWAAACAATVTRVVTADAEVRQGQPSTNFGGNARLTVIDNQQDPQRWSYLKFDISGLANACNLTAKLRVDGQNRAGGTNIPVAAYAVADTSWGESTITWNNKPTVGSVLGSTTVVTTNFQWYEIDVTSHVRAQYLAGATLVTLALKVPSTVTGGGYAEFHSKESSVDPELAIEINPLVAGCTGTYSPLADTYTEAGKQAGQNFGGQSALKVSSNSQWAYLKFDVANVSGGIASAKLRLWGKVNGGSLAQPVAVYSVADTSWGEFTLTWNNQPSAEPIALSSANVPTNAGWNEWDVTSYVNFEHAAGRTVVTLALKGVSVHDDWNFNSRENASNKPYLYIEVAEQPNIAYMQVDHLNTPRIVADSTGTTVWKWDQEEPFGANAANEDPDGNSTTFDLPLRLPGQWYDDETGLHYNYYRDFDPSLGIYKQSDLIGLLGGLNTYVYAHDPLTQVDPFGLMGRGAGSTQSRSSSPWPREFNDTSVCKYYDQRCSGTNCPYYCTYAPLICRNAQGAPFPVSFYGASKLNCIRRCLIREDEAASKAPKCRGSACLSDREIDAYHSKCFLECGVPENMLTYPGVNTPFFNFNPQP